MIEINIAPEELNLPFPLRPYQWEGVSFLLQSESALLADEMGLGKTVQTAIALQLMLQHQLPLSIVLFMSITQVRLSLEQIIQM